MASPQIQAKCSLLIGMLVAPSSAFGALTVIYDSGDTHPLAPFLKVFNEQRDRGRTAHVSPVPPSPPALGASNLERLLPIQSPGFTPGAVEPRTMKRLFTRPFFLIGSGPLSRAWLATHRNRLAEIGAVGMLVEARTVDDLRAIAVLAKGLPILPASASDIAKALDLSHYPVLMTADGLEQ